MTSDRPLYEPPAETPAHLAHAPRCAHPDCEAVLLGIDPPGPHCRHHAPRHRDNQDHTDAA